MSSLKKFNYLLGECDGIYHEFANKFKMSDSQMRILYTICDLGKTCSIKDLIFYSGLTKQTINSALRELENKEIIFLSFVDKKSKSVSLTNKGEKICEDSVELIIKFEEEIISSWSDEEISIYLNLMKKYNDGLRKRLGELK